MALRKACTSLVFFFRKSDGGGDERRQTKHRNVGDYGWTASIMCLQCVFTVSAATQRSSSELNVKLHQRVRLHGAETPRDLLSWQLCRKCFKWYDTNQNLPIRWGSNTRSQFTERRQQLQSSEEWLDHYWLSITYNQYHTVGRTILFNIRATTTNNFH